MKLKRPKLAYVGDGTWELLEDFECLGYVIPAGFMTDLDSVPRIPFVYARYKGRTVSAALLHDFFYKRQIVTRDKADRLFLAAMILENVPVSASMMIWSGVRVGGYFPWKRNARRLKQ